MIHLHKMVSFWARLREAPFRLFKDMSSNLVVGKVTKLSEEIR
jgi:hypothetical protein